MTKAHLKFPSRPVSYLPKIQSRRMGLLRNIINAAYKSDGGTDAPADAPTAEETAALERIKKEVENEYKVRGIQITKDASTEAVKQVTEMLKGLDMEALRKFDATKVSDDVLKMTAELTKLRNAPKTADGSLNAIKELLKDEKTMQAIERAFGDRDGNHNVRINARAAVAVMTTGNVVNDGDIPEDILNSFSVEAFQKKRRPDEFIFQIAGRRTVANIKEYKTWLEEGSEEGAFAIVSEGAIKPLVSKTLVRGQSKYFKVAGKRVYTEEFVKFREEAYNILEDLFNDQLIRNYASILVTRLATVAASYVATSLDDQYTVPTDYHAIGAVAAQIESLEFMPDIIIIHPQDKWRIGLQQASGGAGGFYLPIPVYNPSGTVSMMGFRVVTSTKVSVGNFYLGESGLYKIEDEAVSVRMGYGINVTKNGDGVVTDVTSDVDNNRFRIIAEMYAHSYITTANIGSFVYASFNTVKAALLKP